MTSITIAKYKVDISNFYPRVVFVYILKCVLCLIIDLQLIGCIEV